MTPRGFTQVVIAGPRNWYSSRADDNDKEGKVVAPGDLKAQIRQAAANLKAALTAAGATHHDMREDQYLHRQLQTVRLFRNREARAELSPRRAASLHHGRRHVARGRRPPGRDGSNRCRRDSLVGCPQLSASPRIVFRSTLTPLCGASDIRIRFCIGCAIIDPVRFRRVRRRLGVDALRRCGGVPARSAFEPRRLPGPDAREIWRSAHPRFAGRRARVRRSAESTTLKGLRRKHSHRCGINPWTASKL